MQLDLFPEINRSQLTEEMFEAYFECRKNKRNTLNALQFEKNLEKNVFELIDEVFTGNYNTGPCDTSKLLPHVAKTVTDLQGVNLYVSRSISIKYIPGRPNG